jgi:hypothetical protein
MEVEPGCGRSWTLSGTFDEQVVQVVVVAPGLGEGWGGSGYCRSLIVWAGDRDAF